MCQKLQAALTTPFSILSCASFQNPSSAVLYVAAWAISESSPIVHSFLCGDENWTEFLRVLGKHSTMELHHQSRNLLFLSMPYSWQFSQATGKWPDVHITQGPERTIGHSIFLTQWRDLSCTGIA